MFHIFEKRFYFESDVPYFIIKLYKKQNNSPVNLYFNNLSYLHLNNSHINNKYICYIASYLFKNNNIDEYMNYLLINNIIYKVDNASNLYELTPTSMLQLLE